MSDVGEKTGIFGIADGKVRYVKEGRGLFTAESSFGDKIKVWLPRGWDKHQSYGCLCDPVGKVVGIKYVEDEDDYIGKHLKVEVRTEADYPVFLDNYNMVDFVKKSSLSIDEMKLIIESQIEKIENNEFRMFTKFVIDKHWEAFSIAPAAVKHHHNYFGGLLEHTIGVVRIVLERIEFMKMRGVKLDESLLIASGILHDIGKIREYMFVNFAIEKNNNYHIISGPVILNLDYQEYVENSDVEKLLGINDFERIIFMIECHHGFKEWGSYVLPKDIGDSIEGNILFRADFLDAGSGFIQFGSGRVDCLAGFSYRLNEMLERELPRYRICDFVTSEEKWDIFTGWFENKTPHLIEFDNEDFFFDLYDELIKNNQNISYKKLLIYLWINVFQTNQMDDVYDFLFVGLLHDYESYGNDSMKDTDEKFHNYYHNLIKDLCMDEASGDICRCAWQLTFMPTS